MTLLLLSPRLDQHTSTVRLSFWRDFNLGTARANESHSNHVPNLITQIEDTIPRELSVSMYTKKRDGGLHPLVYFACWSICLALALSNLRGPLDVQATLCAFILSVEGQTLISNFHITFRLVVRTLIVVSFTGTPQKNRAIRIGCRTVG